MSVASLLSPAAAERLRDLQTEDPQHPIRLNSRDYDSPTNSSIGIQSKPNLAVSSTQGVIGAEISPRLASGIALTGAGGLTGAHISTDMKGTAGGNVAGDVHGLEVTMESDLASGRTIAGNVDGVYLHTNLAATVSGLVSALRVVAGGQAAGQWDALANIDAVAGVFDSADTNTAGTKRGFIKLSVGGVDRFLRLYDSGV